MFTEDDRNQIRARLLERAHEDRRVTSAAVTGSASHGAEDRWSDIDLFFGVAAEIALEEILGGWSEFMYQELGALHHSDLQSGSAIYRAFLLPECLEVDLAFTPAAEFGTLGPHFPEERRTVYSMLGLRVDALPDKCLRVQGALGEENSVWENDRTSTR